MQRRTRIAVAAVALAVSLLGASCSSRALIDPTGGSIYWGTDSPHAVQRVDVATRSNTVLPTLAAAPRGGLIAPDGTRGYAILDDGSLQAMSLPDGTLSGAPLALGLGTFAEPPMTAMAPDGSTAVIGRLTAGTSLDLVAVDLATMTIARSASIAATQDPAETAAFTPDGAYVIALEQDFGRPVYAIKIRVADLAVVARSPALEASLVRSAGGVVLSPDGASGYAISDTRVTRFDVATMTPDADDPVDLPGATTGMQPGALLRSADGQRLYLIQRTDPATLVAIDTGTMRIAFSRTVADASATDTSYWAALSPDGRDVHIGTDAGHKARVAVATAYALTVSATGPGAVQAPPDGAPCRGSCSSTLLDYQTATLSAVPDAHATFTGWGGACTGTATTCTVPMTEARSVTAVFAGPSNRIRQRRAPRVRVGTDGVAFTTVVVVPGPGTIRQTGSIRTRSRALRRSAICHATAAPTKAGAVTLVCQAGGRLRARAARQRVRVLLTTVFRPTGGTPRTVRRTVIVPRTPYASGPPVTG